MPREISDEEYAFLQQKRQTADFVESIYNDPKLNKEAKRLIKQKYPNLAIPDYDIEEKVEARLTKAEQDKQKADNEARQRAEDEAWRTTRTRVQSEYGFTDEAMGELEKFMQEKNIGDYEVAAGYRASKNPKSSDPTDTSRWQHDKQPDFAKIATDPEAWGRQEILSAIHRDQEAARGRY
jgi:hypothetical protein